MLFSVYRMFLYFASFVPHHDHANELSFSNIHSASRAIAHHAGKALKKQRNHGRKAIVRVKQSRGQQAATQARERERQHKAVVVKRINQHTHTKSSPEQQQSKESIQQ
jgi:hypothetical protein